MNTDTDRLVLEVPILKDETVHALHTVLLDLLAQLESHYGHQLRRHWLELDAKTRNPLQPWQHLTEAGESDENFNDEIPF